MANQPHPSKRAVTYRLDGDLVDRVKATAGEMMEPRYRLEVALTCRLIVDTWHDGPDPLGAYTVVYRDSADAAQREVDRLNAQASA